MTNEFKVLFREVFDVDLEKEETISFMGTPIVNPIIFRGGQYDVENYQKKNFNDFNLPSTTIVDFDRSKILSTTPINRGLGGHVTESFGFDNWRITLRGFCLYDPNQKQGLTTALRQEQMLMEWELISGIIYVIGSPFQLRDIPGMIIDKISMPTLRGKPGIRPFTITARGAEDPLFIN